MKKIMAVCKPDWKALKFFLVSTGLAALILLIFAVPAAEPPENSVYTLAADNPDLQTEKVAYLTFDDGPSEVTAELLDLLREKQVKASFFVIGEGGSLSDADRIALWKRTAKEGHLLGLHTWSHENYRKIYASAKTYEAQLSKLSQAIEKATGQKPACFRFPGGSSNSYCSAEKYREIVKDTKNLGMEFYDWNVDSGDAIGLRTSEDAVASHVIREAKKLQQPVILMHDIPTCKGSVKAVLRIIEELQKAGYRFDTVDHLKKPVHQHVKGA